MALNFLQAILSNDEPLPLEVTKYVIDNMVNEHPSIRNVCISLVNQIMGILKTRSISQSHREYLDLEKCSVDEIRKSFSYESSVKVGIAFLDDASNTGWLCWPSKVKVYPIVSRAEDTYLHDPTSKDSEDYVRKTVSSPDFWRKHVNFMTQEHNNESQPFNVTTVQLYKKMLQFFGPSLIPFLEPCITECVSQVTDKSKQRCVAELLSGIVRGSKHWRETSRAEVLPFVVTTFQKGLSGATTESVMYWGECLKNMFVSFS